jgi:hypothetical protein
MNFQSLFCDAENRLKVGEANRRVVGQDLGHLDGGGRVDGEAGCVGRRW